MLRCSLQTLIKLESDVVLGQFGDSPIMVGVKKLYLVLIVRI